MMTKRPEPSEIMSIARTAGVPVDQATAERIARSIGPAMEAFASVPPTLPFDIEPSGFVMVQRRTQHS